MKVNLFYKISSLTYYRTYSCSTMSTLTLLTLLVATAALAGATGPAPNPTVAGHQATRGSLGAPAESVEKTCLQHGGAHDAGSLLGAQHNSGPLLRTHGATHSPADATPPTAEYTTTTKNIADDKTPSYKTKTTPTYHKKTPFTNVGTCRVGTSADATTNYDHNHVRAP